MPRFNLPLAMPALLAVLSLLAPRPRSGQAHPRDAAPPVTAPSAVLLLPAAAGAPPAPAANGAAARRTAPARPALQHEQERRLEATRKDVAALLARHDATTDPRLRRALQQRIEATKREGGLDLFRIQLRHAQAAGRLAEARELEALLAARAQLPVAPLLPPPSAAPPLPPARFPRPVKAEGR